MIFGLLTIILCFLGCQHPQTLPRVCGNRQLPQWSCSCWSMLEPFPWDFTRPEVKELLEKLYAVYCLLPAWSPCKLTSGGQAPELGTASVLQEWVPVTWPHWAGLVSLGPWFLSSLCTWNSPWSFPVLFIPYCIGIPRRSNLMGRRIYFGFMLWEGCLSWKGRHGSRNMRLVLTLYSGSRVQARTHTVYTLPTLFL